VCWSRSASRVPRFIDGAIFIRLEGQKATLRGISLVKRGAVEQAFCFLSDDVNNPTVRGLDRSTIFALDRLTHNVKRATRTQVEKSADLVARVDRLCERAGISPT
jgi:hypothetical protein